MLQKFTYKVVSNIGLVDSSVASAEPASEYYLPFSKKSFNGSNIVSNCTTCWCDIENLKKVNATGKFLVKRSSFFVETLINL